MARIKLLRTAFVAKRLVAEAVNAKRLVVVTAPIVAVLIFAEFPVAVVKPSELVKSEVDVTPTSVVFPVTFNVPATFNVPVTLDEAATNPPKN